MIKKQTFFVWLFAIFGFSATQSHAQIDTFNLSSYTKPKLERHQLDFQFNFDNNWDNSYSKTQEITEGYDIWDQSRFNLGAIMNGAYKGYFNSRKYQGEHTINLKISPDFSITDEKKPSSSSAKERSFSTGLQGTSYNRFYLGDLFFLESDVFLHDFSLGFSRKVTDREAVSQEDKSTYEDRHLDITIPVLAGKGRIEPVQDARMAVYIMEQLSKKGKLKRTPTKKEIIAFAEKIAEIKNERFFDARNRRVYEMTQLDSFLNKKGLLAKNDIEYFTTMNDYWEYANNPQRGSGQRISLGIEPSYRHIYDFNYQDPATGTLTKTSYKANEYGLFGVIRYNCEKPINLYWQRSLDAEFKFGRENKKMIKKYGGETNRLQGNTLTSSIRYNLGWYPNSRSYYNLHVTGRYSKFFQLEDQFDSKADFMDFSDAEHIDLRAGVSGYYYISPRIRLSGGFNFGYMHTSRPEQDAPIQYDHVRIRYNNWGYDLYFSLKYSLF